MKQRVSLYICMILIEAQYVKVTKTTLLFLWMQFKYNNWNTALYLGNLISNLMEISVAPV